MSKHYDEVTGKMTDEIVYTEAEDAAMSELGHLCGKDRRLTKTEALRHVELHTVYIDVTERGFSSKTLAKWARQTEEMRQRSIEDGSYGRWLAEEEDKARRQYEKGRAYL